MVLNGSHQPPEAASRATLGAVAGYAATLAMTALMQRLHERLPQHERYPLTPREIIQTLAPAKGENATATRTLLAHFAYGALTGAIYGLVSQRGGLASGALYGVGVWSASYLGWIPALKVLKPATQHPVRRNALMIGVHLVWGAVTAWGFSELIRSHRGAFAGGELKDRALSVHPVQAARERARQEPRRRRRTGNRGTDNPSTAQTN
jgi:hypothetical protein